MSSDDDKAPIAVLVAVATAVASFLPAVFLYDTVSRALSPIRHAEEVMGRSLEVLFIGGPICALLLASIAGWLTYRSNSAATNRIASAFVLACAFASLALARGMKFF